MNKPPYVYCKTPQGKQVIQAFPTISSLLWWIDRYCEVKNGYYFYKGYQIFCSLKGE